MDFVRCLLYGIPGGTSKAQVFVILHELAHAVSAKGFEDDFRNSDAGKRNDDRINDHCRKTLGEVK